MKIALVYDRVNKFGGAERVLLALHEIWPDAPLYTAVYDPKGAPWANVFDVRTTFLQHIPFAKRHHEFFPWLTPFGFGALSFEEFDVVISVTSAEAKSIITKPETLHICFCLTPTRYLWSSSGLYRENTGFGIFHGFVRWMFQLWLPVLRKWDRIASQRPDTYIAISHRVKKRIQEYYGNNSAVIYPPVDIDFFRSIKPIVSKGEYYLLVCRLVPYKRADIIVRACSSLKRRLVVIGDGSDKKRLMGIAGPTVEFIDRHLTDKELLGYHQHCRAFLYAGDEDFGIVAGEAQACGKPVIAYKKSGVSEIILEGKTGILFSSQSAGSMEEAIRKFETMNFSSQDCRENALRFSRKRFKNEMKDFVERIYKKFTITK